jgi:hypothetical protein
MILRMLADMASVADTSVAPPPACATTSTGVSSTVDASTSCPLDGSGRGAICSGGRRHNIATPRGGFDQRLCRRLGSGHPWSHLPPLKLAAPDEGGGTAGSTTTVATISPLWACSASDSV